jgi:hypothetical protein
MARQPMNPWIANSLLDTCAFDPKYEPETSSAVEIFRLHEEQDLSIVLAHSVTKEIEHPNTPSWVKRKAQQQIFTLQVGLNPDEVKRKGKIHAVLTGNSDPAKHAQDTSHIFEAQKYGSYFVTTDERILKKAVKIQRFFPVCILKPSAFLAIVRASSR